MIELGYLLVAMSAMLIVFLRIKSIDLTEGQALIELWPGWMAAALGLFYGIRKVER